MLLFIAVPSPRKFSMYDFNTSHVTVYPNKPDMEKIIKVYFNTSHVTVYHYRPLPSTCLRLISIHLMLLFIGKSGTRVYRIWIFQYISCYCLSWKLSSRHPGYLPFQYISCYCLSHLRHHSITAECDFNTSHVTVYPFLQPMVFIPRVFQYISCYCLSAYVGLGVF